MASRTGYSAQRKRKISRMTVMSESLNRAVQHHQQGDFASAEKLYRNVLRINAGHPDALHLLGVLAHQQQRHDEAIHYIGRAISVNDSAPMYHCNLGSAFRASSQDEKALNCFRRAIALQPEYAGAHYNLGMTLERLNEPAAAQRAYEKALALQPGFAEAHNNLGNLLLNRNRYPEAIERFRQAVEIQPENAQFHFNLANAFSACGKTDDAIEALRVTLELAPCFAAAHNNLGLISKERGDIEEAMDCFREAIHFLPDNHEGYANLASCQQLKEQFAEALDNLKKAAELAPEHVNIHYQLGRELQRSGEYERALEIYSRVIELQPLHAMAWIGSGESQAAKGDALGARMSVERGLDLDPEFADGWKILATNFAAAGEAKQAIRCLQEVHRLEPDNLQALFELANVHLLAGETEQACELFNAVIAEDSEHASAWNHLGNTYNVMGKSSQALECFERSLAIDPDSHRARSNLAEAYRTIGQSREAAAQYKRVFDSPLGPRARVLDAWLLPPIYQSNEELLEWRERLMSRTDRLIEDGIVLDASQEIAPNCFYLAYQGFDERDNLERMSRVVTTPIRSPIDLTQRKRSDDGKIHIGFISQFFKNHTIGFLLMGLVSKLNRDEFHVTVLSHVAHQDNVGQFFQQHADDYVVLTENIPRTVKKISDLELDVLYYSDIGMDAWTHTLAHNRLAPVQCVTWGHPVTTGIDTIDYFVSSEYIESPEADGHFTETLVRLPSMQFYYPRPNLVENHKTRLDFGLPENGNLYACPQSLFKFHPDFDEVVGGILREDPDGYLVLIKAPHDQWTRMLEQRYERTIPDVADRVIWLPRQTGMDYLALVAASDVSLDTVHFGSGNTTYQSLAFGVPFVTCPTGQMRTRVTTGMYKRMNVPDCIAKSFDEYVEIAVRLGTEHEFRHHVSQQIHDNSHLLFDDEDAVRQTEQFLHAAVKQARNG